MRVLQPLWAPEAWHVPREEADEGPLVRRRMARGGGFDPSRVLGKGRLTMEARMWSLKHSGRLVKMAPLA